MRGEYYPNIAELSKDEVAKQAPFGAKWRLLAQVEVRCYILISNISGSVKVAPLQILQFPVILPHKFQDAEKFNLQFSDFSEITETADKLRWLRYQKGLRQRDVADYAGIYRSTYIHYEEYGKDFYSPKHMEKIAQLFEVPVERLLDDYNLFLRNGQGKQIKAIRMKLGLTQREYADKTVYVERGKCAQIEWENSAVTGQIQIRKYSSEDNTVTGQLAGTPLEGAVFEITQARSGKVVGYIVTDARGVAASGPLPLGRYFVTEVSAPKYYQLSGEKIEAEIEYPSQIIKLSAYNKPASLGVTIKKSGNYEVQSGQSMSYDFSGIANTSNVALNHFFWHDRIPTDATRALSISTGTYNARLYYKVTFKTNLNDYRTLASNLLTSNNYSLSLNAATLRLAQGEYVTDVRFEFGTVPSGFSSVVKPTMRVQVLGTVSNGYQIINRADVGGQYLNEWQTAKTTWVTTVRRFNTTPLPKTGY